ncbi:MAG: cytochrome c maturation protein CcmE [Bdellovibrionales bacterium]|nr:cytochrome c maturation protein CcmE [Bdellovibrionales bacterium]
MKLKQTKWIIGLTFIVIGVFITVMSTLPKATQYYVTVDELMRDKDKYTNEDLKVAGKVVSDSIVKNDQAMTWTFQVENNNSTVDVFYKGAMPDTFKETADVVVTGRFDGQKHVIASSVLAKCASRYEEKLQPSYDIRKN